MISVICHPRITSQGLLGRTAAVLAHEHQRYEHALEDLTDEHAGEHIDPVEPVAPAELTVAVVLRALGGPTTDSRTTAAAFLAGRCMTDDRAVETALDGAVADVVSSINASERLGPHAHTYVEAVMALGLRSDTARAIELLTAQLTHPEFRSAADSRAAGYLAQLGSPVGYPVLLEDLHQTGSAFVRLRALEDLMPFVPHEGARVGATVVNVAGELRRAAADEASVAEQARRVAAALGIALGAGRVTR